MELIIESRAPGNYSVEVPWLKKYLLLPRFALIDAGGIWFSSLLLLKPEIWRKNALRNSAAKSLVTFWTHLAWPWNYQLNRKKIEDLLWLKTIFLIRLRHMVFTWDGCMYAYVRLVPLSHLDERCHFNSDMYLPTAKALKFMASAPWQIVPFRLPWKVNCSASPVSQD